MFLHQWKSCFLLSPTPCLIKKRKNEALSVNNLSSQLQLSYFFFPCPGNLSNALQNLMLSFFCLVTQIFFRNQKRQLDRVKNKSTSTNILPTHDGVGTPMILCRVPSEWYRLHRARSNLGGKRSFVLMWCEVKTWTFH